MPLFLSNRDTLSKEKMDDPNCDPDELENTYRQFSTINALISQWKRIYKKRIRPRLKQTTNSTLLDIGFGGGDIPTKIAQWAAKDGFNLTVTAIDPDPRAFDFIKKLEHPTNITFQQCSASDLASAGQLFDFVISNHLLHHLNDKALNELLETSKSLSTQSVIFNDIRRSDLGFLLFRSLATPLFRSSFITYDGLTSIKRSYTASELRNAASSDWEVHKLFPFRLLLTYKHG